MKLLRGDPGWEPPERRSRRRVIHDVIAAALVLSGGGTAVLAVVVGTLDRSLLLLCGLQVTLGVLLLAEDGVLRLAETVGKHLPWGRRQS